MTDKRFNKLIQNLREAEAFEILYNWYYPRIVSHVYFKFGNRNLGEEVAQEFFVKLLSKPIDGYIKKPTAWVYVVCDNIAKDMFAAEDKYNLAYTVEGTTSSDGVFDKILYGEYLGQIDKLDKETAKIIKLHFYEGYKLKEIAEMSEMNYSTVRQKCARAVQQLRGEDIPDGKKKIERKKK